MYTGFTKTFGYWALRRPSSSAPSPGRGAPRRRPSLPLALSASVASITEPLDFCSVFPARCSGWPMLPWRGFMLLQVLDVTAFSSNLFASLLLNLSAGADATRYPLFYLLGRCRCWPILACSRC